MLRLSAVSAEMIIQLGGAGILYRNIVCDNEDAHVDADTNMVGKVSRDDNENMQVEYGRFRTQIIYHGIMRVDCRLSPNQDERNGIKNSSFLSRQFRLIDLWNNIQEEHARY